MNNKMIKAIICPVNGDYEVKTIENNIDTFYEIIGCDTIDIKRIDKGFFIIIDDNGRLLGSKTNPHLYPVMRNHFGMGIAGNYIITNVNEEGYGASLDGELIDELCGLMDCEKKLHAKLIIDGLIKEEEDYIAHNPEVLKPIVKGFDSIEDFFSNL